jgi:hypothetical protein
MTLTTFAARAAAALVAAVAGAASFEHISTVAIGAGERHWVGYALPLAIDGLIVVGVAALLEDKRARRAGRPSARFAVSVGVLATLAANIASAQPTWTARLVAVAAPVSFLIAVEVLTRTGRPLPDDPTPAAPDTVTTADTPRRRVSAPSAAGRVAKAAARWPDASQTELAKRTGLSTRTVSRHLSAARADSRPDSTPVNGADLLAVEVTT